MFPNLVVSISLAAGICVPFYLPYRKSKYLSSKSLHPANRIRKYPAIGPFFHMY
ncbi:hypothetical protein BDV25DRAFT_38166 [Aspergillus avenaceus]|uniref:Uncharacterized protein n=1 Tax=Aspergillus avenaceus TaxID=36643 RepID=A0A5N6U9A2_ASPAV|nr:hypothetical protein BDV25DRAFT_38166 [Aspergillus avenaceus]